MESFTLFLVMFLAGWNDASQGPLLPSLQEYYNVNYTISTYSYRAFTIVGLSDSIDDMGSQFWWICNGRCLQCLANRSSRFRYRKSPHA